MITAWVRELWRRHGRALLIAAVAIMTAFAILKLVDEFYRLLLRPPPYGARDLLRFIAITDAWFSGEETYYAVLDAVYPPATYLIFWPFMGWLSAEAVRWSWALLTIGALVWLSRVSIRESGAKGRWEAAFAVLLLLSLNGTGAGVGLGQLSVPTLPLLVGSVLLLRRSTPSWRVDTVVAVMMLLALSKPTLSAPFFWLILFVPGRIRPAALILGGYVVLTAASMTFQTGDVMSLLTGAFDRGLRGAAWGAARGGYANVHTWLTNAGWSAANGPASLVILGGFGVWAFVHRRTDIWVQLGVTALVARFWAYHRIYDDVLILLPLICLFRLAKRETPDSTRGLIAGTLLGATALSMLVPARLIRFSPPWPLLLTATHAIMWVLVLVFLLDEARRSRRATASPAPAQP